MKLLLHVCCGPCSLYPIRVFREEDIMPTLYYHNPNIHPFKEWKERKKSFCQVAEEENLPYLIDKDYPLEEFLRGALAADYRCGYCYEKRLRQTAAKGKEEGCEAFSTTLLVSPYQNHALLAEMGQAIGEEMGIPFVYRDFRLGFQWAQEEAVRRGLYRQKYCGCVFSERDRYRKVKKNGMAEHR